MTVNYDISERERLIDCIYKNTPVIIDKKDYYMSNILMQKGTYEPESIRSMSKLIK